MKKFLAIILALLILLLTLLSLLLFTPAGLRLALLTARIATPYHLKASYVSGMLTGPIRLENIHLTYHKNDIAIDTLTLNWQLQSLITQQIHIKSIDAGHITIHRQQSTSPTPSLDLTHLKPLSLPKHLQIDNTTIQSLDFYHRNTTLFQSKDIEGHAIISNERIDLNTHFILTSPITRQNQISVKGSLTDYQFKIKSYDNSTQVNITGTGNRNHIQFSTIHSKIADGTLSTQTRLQWYPYLKWKTTSTGSHINPHLLLNHLNEPSLNFSLHSEGQWNKKIPELSIDSTIKTNNTHITLQGTLNQHSSLNWSIASKDIQLIFPDKKGAISSEGKITGSIQSPIVDFTATAQHLDLKNISAQSAYAKGRIHFNKTQSSQLSLQSTNMRFYNAYIKSMNIDATGPLKHIQIKTTSTFNNHASLSTTSTATVSPQLVSNTLHTVTLTTPHQNTWRQTQPSTQQFNKHLFKTSPLCLSSHPSSQNACVSGSWEKHANWDATLHADQIPSSLISMAITPKNLLFDGTFSLHANLAGHHNKIINAQITGTLNPGTITAYHAHDVIPYPYQGGQLDINLKDQSLVGTLNLQLNKNDHITTQIKLPHVSATSILNKTQPLEGSLITQINDANLNGLLLPNVNISKGDITSNLLFSGTLAQPTIEGPLNLKDMDLSLPKLGLTLTDAQCHLQAKDNTIQYTATLYSDKNPLILHGNAQLDPDGWTTTAHLTGDKVLIANNAEYKIRATPNLKATIKGNNINVTGDLDVSDTQIILSAATNVIQLPSSDIVYQDRQRAHLSDLWVLTGKVNGTISDNVFLNLQKLGIKGNLHGALTIFKEPRQDLSANGEISIYNGTFEHYGSQLEIVPHSNINFTNSPITNPNLNLKAAKLITQTDTISQNISTSSLTVGIQLLGTIANPEINFYSFPDTLSETDIISYLILGHPFSYTDKSSYESSTTAMSPNASAVQLFDAIRISESGLADNSGITNSIERKLGLSELGVEAGDTVDAIGTEVGSQAYFVVGRYLSKRLYFRYSSGLIDPISIIQLRYYFSPKWMLQMSTFSTPSGSTDQSSNALDNDSGADILYTIEK